MQAAPVRPGLELRWGDHVCLLGNALAERMQHDGWLETLIQTRFPDHELFFRNLGFSADELFVHQRAAGFGSWDDYLTRCQADVILAFFGYNESFAGLAGLERFRQDLEAFIAHTLGQKYDGRSAPRLVLFSSIPHEDLKDPVLPDGKAHNARIELYTETTAEVAKAKGVSFVDLYAPMQAKYAAHEKALTLNGIHLLPDGNKALAEVIDAALFAGTLPRDAAARDAARIERTRQMVLDKNLHWHQRYRVSDGYNVYGGRSKKVYVARETGERFANFDVLQEEMHALDVMTANRDKVIWAVAAGEAAKVDDSNLPMITQVKTNKPGKGPGGAHEYISGQAGIAKMTPAKGMKIDLFADEEQFPELVNPVQMAWDTKGRLWVAVWPTYPRWTPGEKRSDKLVILEDTDGDGKADKCKTFADELVNPTGFEFWNGGVYVASAPDVLFLKDTDGDDKADVRTRVLHGLSSADTHHSANSFVFGPGGALYFQEGTFHMSQIESIYGPIRNRNGCVWRFEPRTWRVERYIPHDFANPHGHVFDDWGQDFMTDGTGNVNYYSLPFSGYILHPQKHTGYFSFFRQRSRPCAGTEILTSQHFPKENQGNLLIANVIGFLGIFQYKFVDQDSGFTAEEVEPIVSSTDPNFRPSDIEVGPDGAIYFLDWHNAIIGHLQHHIRDPSRDDRHGRVYRVTCEGRPLTNPAGIAGQPIPALLESLKSRDYRVRYRTRIELSGRRTEDVLAAAEKWVKNLDASRESDHHLLEALWLYQQHGRANPQLLTRLLNSKSARVRAAATRVLRYTRHWVPGAIALLAAQAKDDHPRVRLEAVVGASFFDSAEAATVALEALRKPTDKFLDYAIKETLKALEPHWKLALQQGKAVVAPDNAAGIEFLLSRVNEAELVKLPRTPVVLHALLTQHGVDVTTRLEAARTIAKQNGTTDLHEVLQAIRRLDRGRSAHASHVLQDLGALLNRLMSGPRKPVRSAVVNLAEKGRRPMTQKLGYAALIALDGTIDRTWKRASTTRAGLRAILDSVPMIADPSLRAGLYDKVRPLMFALPVSLRTGESSSGPGLSVAYYSPAPRNADLTSFAAQEPQKRLELANFRLDIPAADRGGSFGMVYRGIIRVPKKGRYEFFTNSDDGSRLYLGSRLVVNNDEHHGMVEKRGRIQLSAGSHPIVLTYFDQGGNDGLRVSWRGPGFRKQPIPDDVLSHDDAGSLRRAAVVAMAYVPGHEKQKFVDVARLIGEARFLDPAIDILRKVPAGKWPKDQIHSVVDTLAGYVTNLPAEQRTAPQVVAALQLGHDLVKALPKEVADAALKRLRGLGGSTILIRTVPHKMLYDVTEFSVEKGKPVAIVFQNNDMMPHNLVITRPGALERVGREAEKLDGKGSLKRRHYVPDTTDVLWWSKLLYPGNSERLAFVAPARTGDYPFVCTFPGHWTVMNGVMRVVDKVDETKRVIKRTGDSEEVTVRTFVKNWTMKDIAGAIDDGWQKAHSADRGRALFSEAGCIKCHAVAGKGIDIGPKLEGVGKKYKDAELLKHLLEPSAVITEGYSMYYIELKDGEVVLGRVMKEDAKALHVLTDPDNSDKLTVVPKDEIKERMKSPISTMPAGLLVTLKKNEILDLLVFVKSL